VTDRRESCRSSSISSFTHLDFSSSVAIFSSPCRPLHRRRRTRPIRTNAAARCSRCFGSCSPRAATRTWRRSSANWSRATVSSSGGLRSFCRAVASPSVSRARSSCSSSTSSRPPRAPRSSTRPTRSSARHRASTRRRSRSPRPSRSGSSLRCGDRCRRTCVASTIPSACPTRHASVRSAARSGPHRPHPG